MDLNRKYADYLDESAVSRIRDFERETGKLVLAYYTPPVPAKLSPDQVQKLQELENQMCVRLVAYESHSEA